MKKNFYYFIVLILLVLSYINVIAQDVSGGISTDYGTVIYKLQFPNGVVQNKEGVGRIHIQRSGNYDAQWNLTYLGIPGTPVRFAIAIKHPDFDQNQWWVVILGPNSPYNGSGNYTLQKQEYVLFVYYFDSTQRSDFVGGYASNGPPAAPQNVQATTIVEGGESYAKVTWNLSSEEDVSNYPYGTYQLWRRKKITNWEVWTQIATLPGNVSSYIDYNIYGAGSGPNEVEYKLRAVDRTNHISDFSSTISLNWGNSMQKRAFLTNSYEYNLIGNYPNPFNPQTKIRFSIKEPGKVLLQVYDILGTQVATLVDEIKPEGIYEITFDGEDLPSGTYFYKLTANGYTAVKKMILTK
jgi:hypothetical protein